MIAGAAHRSKHSGSLSSAALWMGAGTAVSRVSGLVRIVALAYALGATHLADAYNLANTTPNMVYDIVLGGVLSATFIPVFVDRLATREEHEAWRAISAITTVAVVVLVAMTVVFFLFAPEVIGAYTAFDHARSLGPAQAAQERAVATDLLRWFVPQVALYGFISLMTALLNTRRRFAAPMWVPIVNNVVVIAVLLWFHALVPRFPSLQGAHAHPGQLALLGIGTTLGVLLQALALVPSLRGIGLSKLRWHWEPGHEAVRTVARLGGWTFGFVVANQLALSVVLALAFGAPGSDPVSSYTYAYAFMQMPYAVVAVSIMSAVTPDLAEKWATNDLAAFKRRLSSGLRATLAIIVPAAVGMLVLARPAVALLLGHGTTSVSGTDTTGAALALFSLGLPGFSAYLYVVRVLQAIQRTKAAFWLYLVENALNVVLALALVGPLGVRGLALSLTVAYSVAAVLGIALLRRWLGTLGEAGAWAPLRRVLLSSFAMGAVVLVVSDLSAARQGLALLARVVAAVVAGTAVYGGLALLMGNVRWRPAGGHGPGGHGPGGRGPGGQGRGGRGLRGGGLGERPWDQEPPGPTSGGLGDAWGDTRVPANTGAYIKILPKKAPADRAPAAGAPAAGTPADRAPAAGTPTAQDHPGELRWVAGTHLDDDREQ